MGKRSRARRAQRVARPADAAPQLKSRDTQRAMAISAALFISVAVVYGQLATHDFINYDDVFYVTQNDRVTSGVSLDNIRWALTEFRSSNWHPLTWMSHMVDVQLFGMNPGMHLMTNLVLHGLNSVLLFLLLWRATAATWRSAAAAALFALHPLHVESVAWVSERKDVLSTFLFMLTLWLYIRWVEQRSTARYLVTLIAFALGLMSKPMLVTLPFVLLLLDWWPLRRFSLDDRSKLKPLVIEKLPMFALIVPSVLLTLKAQKQAIWPVPFSERLANALTSYVAYLGKMLWPAHLAVIYPLPQSFSPAAVVAAAVVLIAITAFALRFARKFPYLPVGWFWYLGTLVPVIGLVQVGRQSMADRYTYIPLIGIFMAIVWLAGEVKAVRKFGPAIAAVVLMACGATSYAQASYWKDSFTLERHALQVTRNNDQAHVLLGSALAARGDRQAAEKEFRSAISINPNNDEAYRDLGRLSLSSHPDEAIAFLTKAAALKPSDSATLAMLAAARGNKQEAVQLFQRALDEGDESADIHNDFAAVLAITGHDQQALTQYHEALRRMPGHYDARMNLGALLSRMGRGADALEQFAAAAKERPEAPEPHVYLALAYANSGRIESAIAEVNQAIAINAVESNRDFTNAVRMPFKETNINEYLAFLRAQRR